MQNKEFITSSRGVYIAARAGEFAAWKFLAGTTAIFSYAMMAGFCSGRLSGWAYWAAVALGTLLAYFIIDGGIEAMLKFLFKTDRKTANRNQRRIGHLIMIFLIFKIGATTTASLWTAPELGDLATSNKGEEAAIQLLLQTEEQQQGSETAAMLHLQQLEGSEAERVAAAKKEGQALIEAAIAKGNKWQRESYRKIGFAWLLNPGNGETSDHDYANGIKAAQQKADELVQLERQRTLDASSHVAAVSTDTAYQSTAALLRQKAAAERQKYQATLSRRTVYFWIFDFAATFFGLFCSYIVVQWQKAAELKADQKTPGTVIGAWWTKRYQDFINFLEDFLGVDIDGDGTIGGPQHVDTHGMASHATAAIGTNEGRVEVRGFQQPKQPGGSGVTAPPLPPETVVSKQAETTVAQASQPVSPKAETTIVTARGEDVSKWRRYASTYFKRSLTSASETTRHSNRCEYEHWRDLLIAAGYRINELADEKRLEIIEPNT